MSINQDELDKAIENCSRDPIHIPGKIQAFGYLLATNTALKDISYVSDNIHEIFDAKAEELIGKDISCLFSTLELEQIQQCLAHETIDSQREVAFEKQISGADYQVCVHQRADIAIIELIPQTQATEMRFKLLERARSVLAIPLEEHDFATFFEKACERLRSINGFDRVKFYRFLPDGSGQVIAESRISEAGSFLGLRFPEADIPPIARKLYAQTPIRTLSDVNGADVPILTTEPSQPLDLSLSVLRGKDKIHTQYLKNMGIASTETVPIVVNGTLWGLFSSHHMTQKDPDPSALSAMELIGKLISLRIQHALESRHQDDLRECLAIANRLLLANQIQFSDENYWSEIYKDMSKLIVCDGMVFSINGRVDSFGRVPEETAQKALLSLGQMNGSGVEAIDRLPERLPDVKWGETAGALIISPIEQDHFRVVYFRDLAERKVNWAGNPEKDVSLGEEGPKLNPRNSFETYIEHIKGRSDEWTSSEINIATSLSEALGQVIKVQSNLKDNNQSVDAMVGELNYRVRNIVSLVQSLSRQSHEEAGSVKAYAEALERRVIALAGATNMGQQTQQDNVPISDIVAQGLDPFQNHASQMRISGPDISLRPDASSILTLLVNELKSNAVKFGALSVPNGTVDVQWDWNKDGLALSWCERGGPKVRPPNHYGFGRSVIEEAIPFEFNGDASLVFNPDGIEANFWLPADVIANSAQKLTLI